MKKLLSLVAAIAVTGGAAFGTNLNLGTFTGLSPNGTFIYQNTSGSNPDICSTPQASPTCNMSGAMFINLTALGVTAGAELIITGIGDICYSVNCSASSELPINLAAVFDSNNTLLGPANATRLTGALNFVAATTNSVTAASNPSTYYGAQSTGGVPDFGILTTASLHVVVPNNPNSATTWLVVGILDSYFADNSNPNGDPLGVTIQQVIAAVPEPGTYAMFLTGLGALLALRRKFNW
jgi:hypothetical protein